jgi:heme oxygenase
MIRLKDTHVAELCIEGMQRTDAFEKELMAYIYNLYMGLLSDGQILRKKCAVVKKFMFFPSEQAYQDAVTDFGPINISKMKKELVEAMNGIAGVLDESTKQKLIEESKTVFVMNNEIIRSIQGANAVIVKQFITIIIIILLTVIIHVTYSEV